MLLPSSSSFPLHRHRTEKSYKQILSLSSFSLLLSIFTVLSSERDNFLKVNWNNIKEAAWFNFKQFSAHVSMFSTPYDYGSIMHYSPTAFAIDRTVPTLVPILPAHNMGQREGKKRFFIRIPYPVSASNADC